MNRLLGTQPTASRRAGSRVLGGALTQSVDVWNLRLTDKCDGQPSEASVARAAATLRHMAPGLNVLDRSHLRAEIYISMTQWQPAFALHFSAEFVAAAATCRLDFGPSITSVDMSDDDDDGSDGAPAPSLAPGWGLAVRLWGALPSREALGTLLGAQIGITSRALPGVNTEAAAHETVYMVPLTPAEDWVDGRLGRASAAKAVAALRRMAPALTALRQAGGRAELHIVFTCHYFSDGFSLPPALIAAASEAGLEIDMLTLWPSGDDDWGDDEEDAADLDDPENIARIQRDLDDGTRRWWTPDTIH
jgi:hypothetical protein